MTASGFTEGRSCMADLVACYSELTALVEKGRATDVIYLDLYGAFGTVLYNIVVFKVERRGFDRWTAWWIRHWLDGYIQRVAVDGSMSGWRPETSGVTQRSVLGPVLFNILLNNVVGNMDSVIECSLNKLADDTKLSGAVDTLEGRDAFQWDLNRLETSACANLMKFTRAKCKVCTWAGPVSNMGKDWVMSGLRAALRRRTWGCWFMRSSI